MPRVYIKKLPSIEYRIARRIRPNGECREWTPAGRKDRKSDSSYRPTIGTGHSGQTITLARLVWELAHGPIPENLWILHRCDNIRCIRTSHLYPGTPSRNTRDAVERGRWGARRLEQHNLAKLTNQQVLEIRSRYQAEHIEQKVLAAEYGVSPSNIGCIVNGKTWKM